MNLGDLASGGGGPELMQMLMRRGGGGKTGGPINSAPPARYGEMPAGGYPAQPGPPRHRMPPGVEPPKPQYPPYWPYPQAQDGPQPRMGMAQGMDPRTAWQGGASPMPGRPMMAQPGGPGGFERGMQVPAGNDMMATLIRLLGQRGG